jgi:hypothetical protein
MAMNCPLNGVEMNVLTVYGGTSYEQCPMCHLIYMVYGPVIMSAPIPINNRNILEFKVNSEGKLEITYQEE